MAWPFPKAAPAGESDEDRKKREEAEQNAFIERIGVSIDAKLKPLSDKVETWDGRWKKLEEAATTPETPPEDDSLTDEQRRRKEDQSEKSKILAVAIATNARITEGEVISEVATKFPHFTDKVTEYFANTPLERKAQADYGAYCRKCKHSARLSLVKLRKHLGDDYPLAKVRTSCAANAVNRAPE